MPPNPLTRNRFDSYSDEVTECTLYRNSSGHRAIGLLLPLCQVPAPVTLVHEYRFSANRARRMSTAWHSRHSYRDGCLIRGADNHPGMPVERTALFRVRCPRYGLAQSR